MAGSLQNTVWFLTLLFLVLKLDHGLKFQKLHIPSLSNAESWYRAYFCSSACGVWDTSQFSTLQYLFKKAGLWQSSKVDTSTLSVIPRKLKLKFYLSLCGQRFSRYRLIFTITIFGHETWQLANAPEVAHTPFFRISAMFRCTGYGFPDTGGFSTLNIATFGHEIWPLAKFQKLHIFSVSTQRVQIPIIFAVRAVVSEIQADCQNSHI